MKDVKTEEPTWNELGIAILYNVVYFVLCYVIGVLIVLLASHLYYQYQIEHLI